MSTVVLLLWALISLSYLSLPNGVSAHPKVPCFPIASVIGERFLLQSPFLSAVFSIQATPRLVFLSHFSVYSSDGEHWTSNLLHEAASVELDQLEFFSLPLVLLKDQTLTTAQYTAKTLVCSDNSSTFTLSNLAVPDLKGTTIAIESWSVSLGNLFNWTVDRHFVTPVEVQTDRHALTLATVTYPPIFGSQVPSFCDLDLFLNTTSNAGFTFVSNWGELQSPHTSQSILLAPTGVQLTQEHFAQTVSGSGPNPHPLFSFMKPSWDGTAPVVSLGMSTIDRRQQPTPYNQGQTIRFSLSFQVTPTTSPGSPYGNFNLHLPPSLSAASESFQLFFRVQNLWLGWMFGNNPASVPVLQELAFFGWIQSLLDTGAASHKALKQQLSFYAEAAQNASGYVYPRWASTGFYDVQWGPMIDQVPNFILAVHSMAIVTGDRPWLESLEQKLDLSMKYLLERGLNATLSPHLPKGVFVGTGSGLPDGDRHASNWFDIIEFGHGDAYNGAYSLAALQAMIDMKRYLGKLDEAAALSAVYDEAHKAYTTAYWRPAAGRFVDWIDANGTERNYFYTDHNLLAVIFHIADDQQSNAILDSLAAGYNHLFKTFNVTPDEVWATPGNIYPILNPNDTVLSSGAYGQYPSYENGGSFFHSLGFEVAALGAMGRADAAWTALMRFMNKGFSINRGWAQQLYWNTGELVGGDPLNNALVVLWGFVRGLLGVQLSLLDVVILDNEVPADLEGTRYMFAWLGQQLQVCVSNQRVVRC